MPAPAQLSRILATQADAQLAEPAQQTGTASVRDVATCVGFTDPAAFPRAYTQWTGRSPSAAGAAG